MNTAIIAIGSAIAGIALGHLATAIYFLPKLDRLERRDREMALRWERYDAIGECQMYERERATK